MDEKRSNKMRSSRYRRQLGSSRGFTLAEMAISSLVMILVIGAIVAVMFQGQRSYQSQQGIIEVTQDARIAQDQIMTYIRQAGNDPLEVFSGMGLSPIDVASPTSITIYSDITGLETAYGNTGDADGDVNDLYETVQIRLDSSELQIKIRSTDPDWRTLAENVSSFSFTFYDLQGNDLGTSPDESLIAKVQVTMVVETDLADLQTGKKQSITLQSEAMMRSRAFTVFDSGLTTTTTGGGTTTTTGGTTTTTSTTTTTTTTSTTTTTDGGKGKGS